MEKVTVSVIIPVYNVEKYLVECLESVISQDMCGIELICINDGSTDKSQEILNDYAERDRRIIVINQENRGLSCARNKGIDYAQGEYLLFLDSDDCLAEHALKNLYTAAQTEGLDILTFDAKCFYETEELKKIEFKDNYYRRKREYAGVWIGEDLFCELIKNDDFCDAAWILFIKNSWLKKTGLRFMPGILHEDCLFSFQCYTLVQRISHRKWEYIFYRIREKSIMTSNPSFLSLLGRLTCYKEVLRFLMSHTLSDQMEKAVSKYAEFIMYNIKYTDFSLEDAQKELTENFPALDRMLMNSMGVGRAGRYTMNAGIYELGFQTLIRSYNELIIYGAGKIGRIVWNYLKKKSMHAKVIGFAVSERPSDYEEIDGIRVRRIDEYKATDDILVLISARWDYQDAMVNNAQNAGFRNIEAIDFRLERIIQ